MRATTVGKLMPEPTAPHPDVSWVGLCLTCRHSKRVETPRSGFWMCTRSATDPRYDKYPRLPMIECGGYERIDDAPAPER